MKKLLALSTLTLFAFSLTACGVTQTPEPPPTEVAPVTEVNNEQAAPEITELPTVVTEEAKTTTNEIDLTTAQVGDEVAGMTIVQLDLPEDNASLPWGSKITFKGRAEVTGEYTYYDNDSAFLSGNVCLGNLTEASIAKLPRVVEDTRNAWFCFSNYEAAQAEFGPAGSTGTATVVVDDYYIPMLEAEVWNTATLVNVVEKS